MSAPQSDRSAVAGVLLDCSHEEASPMDTANRILALLRGRWSSQEAVTRAMVAYNGSENPFDLKYVDYSEPFRNGTTAALRAAMGGSA